MTPDIEAIRARWADPNPEPYYFHEMSAALHDACEDIATLLAALDAATAERDALKRCTEWEYYMGALRVICDIGTERDAAQSERDTLKARVEELEAALTDLLTEACQLDSQVESEFGPYTDGYYNEVIAGARRVLDRKE